MTRIRAGLAHFQPHSPAARLLRYHLLQVHRLDLTDMAYTVEDFKREAMRDLMEDVLSDPKYLKMFLDRLVAEDRLRELTPEERLLGLLLEERLRGLAPEDRLEGLDPAIIEAWLTQHPRRDH